MRALRTIWSFILKVLGKAEKRLQDSASAARQVKRHHPEGVIFVERKKLERLHPSDPTPSPRPPVAGAALSDSFVQTPSPRRPSHLTSTSAAPGGQRLNQLERDRHYVEERLRELQRLQAVAWRNRHPGLAPPHSPSPPAANLTEDSPSLLSVASAAAPTSSVTLPEVRDLPPTPSDLATPSQNISHAHERNNSYLSCSPLPAMIANKTDVLSLGEIEPNDIKVAQIVQLEEERNTSIVCSASPLTDTILEKPFNSSPSSVLLEQDVDEESEDPIAFPRTSALPGVRGEQGQEDKALVSSVRLEKPARSAENGSFFIGRWKLVERRFLNNLTSSW